MKVVTRTLVLVVLAVLGVSAPSGASGAVSCHSVNAKGVGQDLGGGMTTAQIRGGGLLHGTTNATFVITGISGTVASFEGTIVFAVNKGTLSAGLVGTFDVATGMFSGTTTALAGTGKLEGATGNLSLNGVEDLSDGSFTEDVTGAICVDLAP
jgi:hypothetical protein